VHGGQRELQPQWDEELDKHPHERGGIIAAINDDLDHTVILNQKEVRHGQTRDDEELINPTAGTSSSWAYRG
jgi:hypothetical protein